MIEDTKDLEQRLVAEKEEHKETMADYMCLALFLGGHDATECLMNLMEIKRRLAVCREALEKLAEYESWNMPDLYSQPSCNSMVEEINAIAKAALSLTSPLA